MNTVSQVPSLLCRVRWDPCKKVWWWGDSPLGDASLSSQSLLALPRGLGLLSYIRWYKTRQFCLCYLGEKQCIKWHFDFFFCSLVTYHSYFPCPFTWKYLVRSFKALSHFYFCLYCCPIICSGPNMTFLHCSVHFCNNFFQGWHTIIKLVVISKGNWQLIKAREITPEDF